MSSSISERDRVEQSVDSEVKNDETANGLDMSNSKPPSNPSKSRQSSIDQPPHNKVKQKPMNQDTTHSRYPGSNMDVAFTLDLAAVSQKPPRPNSHQARLHRNLTSSVVVPRVMLDQTKALFEIWVLVELKHCEKPAMNSVTSFPRPPLTHEEA